MTSTAEILELGICTYSRARSLGFLTQYILLNSISSFALKTKPPYIARVDRSTGSLIEKKALELFKRDAHHIQSGTYPLAVLKPERPLEHIKRIPRIIRDGLSLNRRKARQETKEFNSQAQEFLGELPRYYRRNFHFQTDGYLSERSAELYEHQVEMLFGGVADAMRRLIIPALRERFGSGDGAGLRFLEIGAGTGRATRFVRLAFPKAKIIVTDLSDPYLKVARRKLSGFHRLDYLQCDGSHLPFQDGHFDAVYSVFLYHELPLAARRSIVAESNRVLRSGGRFGFVDSIQLGDLPEFDSILRNFPEDYHEPFYEDYISRPMEGIIRESGFSRVQSDTGFFSKVCWSDKSEK
jgi:ubiquinone/menaquinone biosynthesis C-methylase UbiE